MEQSKTEPCFSMLFYVVLKQQFYGLLSARMKNADPQSSHGSPLCCWVFVDDGTTWLAEGEVLFGAVCWRPQLQFLQCPQTSQMCQQLDTASCSQLLFTSEVLF